MIGGMGDHGAPYEPNNEEEIRFCDMKGCWNKAVENDKFCRECLGEE